MSASNDAAAESNAKKAKASEDQRSKYKTACDKYVSSALSGNRSIQHLLEYLSSNCAPPDGFIRCTDCGDLQALGAFHLLSETVAESSTSPAAGEESRKKYGIKAVCNSYFSDTLEKVGFAAKTNQAAQDTLMEQLNKQADDTSSKKTPEIFLCQEHLSSEGQAHRTLIHELIHAVDTCRSKMDPQNNCIHLACTEIRAENLSGECNFMNELFKIGPHGLQKHGQECVKRRALLSVSAHPRCRDRAEEYVDAAMGRCYKDVFPFERHPNEQI